MINSYTCKHCNDYNDILTIRCNHCYSYRPDTLEEIAIKVKYERGLDLVLNWYETMSDKLKVDKFMQFYNSGKVLYSAMSFEKRREWRDELAEILMTARANLSASDDVDREESAKLSPEGRQWLESNSEDTQKLNAPKLRKERMSKADKLKEQMLSLGLDITQVRGIMSTVEKTTKESDMNNLVFRKNGNDESKNEPSLSELCRIGEHIVCTGSFGNETGSHSCNCDCHKAVKEKQVEKKEAVFSLDGLKFGE